VSPLPDTLVKTLFSVYHFHLKRLVSRPSPCGPGNLGEIQTAFERILKCGLSESVVDPETLQIQRPCSPNETITQLEENDPRAIDFRNTLRTSFGRAPWSTVRMHEVRQWLHWSIFGTALPDLNRIPPSHLEVVNHTVGLLQKRLGRVIPEGSTNGRVKPSLLTIDKVNVSWRPFFYYVVINSAKWLLHLRLQRRWNLRFGRCNSLELAFQSFRASYY
jgi:hypothetical protein